MTTTAVQHVIVDRPMRCWAQVITAMKLAEQHGATLHLTAAVLGEPRRKYPGMGSTCMPFRATSGCDRCRHDLGALRREGAIDVPADIACWVPSRQPVGEPCGVCGGKWRADGRTAAWDEYPDVPTTQPEPAQPGLF